MKGTANVKSTTRISTSSTVPPAYPEMSPMMSPNAVPTVSTIPAMSNDMRAPKMIRARMSLPNGSVPRMCDVVPPSCQNGGVLRLSKSSRVGS